MVDDHHTRYTWSILLREKSDAFERFKTCKSLLEKEVDKKNHKASYGQRWRVYPKAFSRIFNREGIRRHLTAPYTLQQNGMVERRNRTLMEMKRSMLKATNVPNYMWGELFVMQLILSIVCLQEL